LAKRRGRTLSLDTLMAELSALDSRRKQVVASIQNAVSSIVGGVTSPFSLGRKRGRPAGTKNIRTKGTRKRRKMSAAARAKISAAQKKRWAAQKASKK
jgi:hypothetical protein